MINFCKTITLILLIVFPYSLLAQLQKRDDELGNANQSVVQKGSPQQQNPPSVQSIQSRGFTTHNRSNLGMFIENRGKLYARSAALGVSGEFPINSLQEYIYQLNPFVLFPGNVIQARNSANEEWEAEFGYNPSESAKVAISTDPTSWPISGWPVKDADGNPIFISDQDSFAAFNDSLNREGILGISVYQTGYSFAFPLVRDAVVFMYDVVNRSSNTYNGMYFGLYSDIDVGNAAGVGDPEYNDDRIGYDEDLDLLYFYDDGRTIDWVGGTTGHFGVTYISTPKINGEKAGLTDWHYNLFADTPYWDDNDEILYGIMTSDYSRVPAEVQSRFFHPVEPGRRKDIANQPAGDWAAHSASGPYTINPGDTLRFVIAVVAGRNYDEIRGTTANLHEAFTNNWALPSAPPKPNLYAYAEKNRIVLRWDALAENTPDPLSKLYDFQGYKIYRSINNGKTWDQFDRNIFPEYGPNPVPLAVFDKDDNGIQYSFVDSTVQEGFTYWYSITAYDQGIPVVGVLESAIGNTSDERNIVVVTPLPNSSNWRASIAQIGDHISGSSTDTLILRILDPLDTQEDTYHVSFERIARTTAGNLATQVRVTPTDANLADPSNFTVSWSSPTVFSIRNENAGRNRLRNVAYVPGQVYEIPQDYIAFEFIETSDDPEFQPQAGDQITVSMGVKVIRDSDGEEVIPVRPFIRNVELATTDGIGLTFAYQSLFINSDNNAVQATVESASYSALLDRTYSFTINSVLDSTPIQFVLSKVEASNPAVVDTVENGGLINFGRFQLRLQVDLSHGASSVIGAQVQIRSIPTKEPNEADVFTFTKTAGVAELQSDASILSQINVVPNPYVVSNAWEPDISLQRREPERLIRFRNLPNQCTIHIFTMAGERVKTLHKNDSSGVLGWDLRTEAGREIAPGVYLYKVQTAFGDHVSRFAVIK